MRSFRFCRAVSRPGVGPVAVSLASLLSLAACADHSGLSITGEGDAGAGAGSTGGSGGSTQTGTGGGGGQIRTGGTVGGGGQTGSGGIASGGTTGTGGAVGSGGTTGTGGTVGGGGGTPATGGSGGGNGGTGGSSADAAPMCGAVCAIFCPYGNVLDSRGCPTCQCKPATCSPVRCDIACPYGFVRDANGCEVCKCNPAPACMPVVCKLLCPYGFAKDANGCEICQCNPAPAACTTTECGPAPVLPPYACPDGSVPRAVCERNREGKCVWSVVPCPNCAGYTDATTCSKDTACAWLVPGCTDPALAAAGCYSKTLVDCASKPCPGGKTCMKRTINPCMSSTAGFAPPPGGGVPAPACTACSQVITICL